MLATGETNPRALRLDGAHVRWAAGAPVLLRRVLRSGGSAETIATTQADSIVAETANDVIFTRCTIDRRMDLDPWRCEVLAAPKNGAAPRTMWVTPIWGPLEGYWQINHIVANDEFVFIASHKSYTGNWYNPIVRLGGGGPVYHTRVADGFAVHDGDLYVFSRSIDYPDYAPYGGYDVARIPVDPFPASASAVTYVASDCGKSGVSHNMAFDESSIYAGFVRIPRCASGVLTHLGAVESGPIAVDEQYLYFTRGTWIGRIPK
jgi:hypothetical protein